MSALDGVDSVAQVAALLRVLRRYADSPLGVKLAENLRELGEGHREGLVAFEEGSDERQVEAILAVILSNLSLIVLDLRLEIGSTRLDAAEFFGDLNPDDFAGESW